MIDEIRALLSRHLPSYQLRTITRLGEGWENVAHEVNGELIVRRRKEADPDLRGRLIRQEVELLETVARWSTVPVPEPIFADPDAGVIAYRKLPGLLLREHRVAEPARLAADLGAFISRLNRAPLAEMARLVPRDVQPLTTWLREAEELYREIADRLPAAGRRLVEDFLGRMPPPEPHAVAFCHNDLGSEHLLVDPESGALSGVIDWSDAAIADPMYDFGLIYRDLGPETFELALAHYDGRRDEADRERAVFFARCSLLEDVAYGLRTGERRYVEFGMAQLDRIFG